MATTLKQLTKYIKDTRKNIIKSVSAPGTFAYAIDTGELYVAHESGGWMVYPLTDVKKPKVIGGVPVNTVLHLDAYSGVVNTRGSENVQDGDKIESWTDATGVKFKSGDHKPKYSSTDMNGKPAIDFHNTPTSTLFHDYAVNRNIRTFIMVYRPANIKLMIGNTQNLDQTTYNQYNSGGGIDDERIWGDSSNFQAIFSSGGFQDQSSSGNIDYEGFQFGYYQSGGPQSHEYARMYYHIGGAGGYQDTTGDRFYMEYINHPDALSSAQCVIFTIPDLCEALDGHHYLGKTHLLNKHQHYFHLLENRSHPVLDNVTIGYQGGANISEIIGLSHGLNDAEIRDVFKHLNTKWNIYDGENPFDQADFITLRT